MQYNLEVFVASRSLQQMVEEAGLMAVMTSPSLESLRADFKRANEVPSSPSSEPSTDLPSDLPSSDDTVDTDVSEPVADVPNEDDDDYSDDEMIKGVYCYGPDGEVIQIG